MSIEFAKLDIEKLKALNGQKVALGEKVKTLLESDGFLIFKAVLKNFENDIKDKSDYSSLEDFKADRKALEIVQGTLNELESYVSEAKSASAEIEKLMGAESSTPSLLSLDGEGMDNEEGQ